MTIIQSIAAGFARHFIFIAFYSTGETIKQIHITANVTNIGSCFLTFFFFYNM